MHKLYLPMALLMSLILGSGLAAFTSNSASAQNYGYQDDYYGQSYGGDNSYYSTYPTDDKPYECRTGPFEGFFVSSVEFCDAKKFDDRKDHKDRDNRTGTRSKVHQVHKVHRSTRSTRSIQELTEHKVHQELTEHKVHKVHQEAQY